MSLLKEYAKVLNEFALNRSWAPDWGNQQGVTSNRAAAFHKAIRPPNPCFILFHPWLKLVAFGI
jgi:hypothetical protein